MRTVIQNNPDIRVRGISSALAALEHDCILWDRAKKPILDMYDELSPDYILLNEGDLDERAMQGLALIPDEKQIIYKLKGENSIEYAANLVDIKVGEKKKQYECEYLVLNYRLWPRQQEQILKLPLGTKIFGEHINSPYYMGDVAFRELGSLFASAQNLIAFNDEFIWDAMRHRCFPLTAELTEYKYTLHKKLPDYFFEVKKLFTAHGINLDMSKQEKW